LRNRLLRLRPMRRLHANRLLFVPADCVIVPSARWKRGMTAIPRHTLPCLIGLIRSAMGAEFDAIAAAVDGTLSGDSEAIARHGERLWSRAADVLAQSNMPAEWAGMTDLGLADYLAIARPLSVLLGVACQIEALVQHGDNSERSVAAMRGCLAAAQSRIAALPEAADAALASACLALTITVCLERLPDSAPVLIAAGDLANRSETPAARQAADAAVDTLLAQAETGFAPDATPPPLAELQRLAELLDTLEQPGPAGRPARKTKVVALRRTLESHCRARLQHQIAGQFLPAAANLSQITAQETLLTLEDTARDLRRLEAVGRMTGGAAHYERALADTTVSFVSRATNARRVDLARLVEILQGPEAGLAVLEAGTMAG
jgi:hypothetical protein